MRQTTNGSGDGKAASTCGHCLGTACMYAPVIHMSMHTCPYNSHVNAYMPLLNHMSMQVLAHSFASTTNTVACCRQNQITEEVQSLVDELKSIAPKDRKQVRQQAVPPLYGHDICLVSIAAHATCPYMTRPCHANTALSGDCCAALSVLCCCVGAMFCICLLLNGIKSHSMPLSTMVHFTWTSHF